MSTDSDETRSLPGPSSPDPLPLTQADPADSAPAAAASHSERSDVEEVGGGSQKSRKKKVQITDEEASKLIEFIKANPALWDRDSEVFKKDKEKNIIWETGLKTLSGFESIDEMKKAWANIRDTYTKMHNTSKASGSGAFVPKGSRRILIWAQANFLHSSVSHNKPSQTSNLPYQRRQALSAMAPISDEDSPGLIDIVSLQDPPPPPQRTMTRTSSAASGGPGKCPAKI